MGGHAHGHSHRPSPEASRRWLAVALAINFGFALLEVLVGLLSGSVALLSDAAHMVTDAGAIAIALFAARLAMRPPSGRFTFGLRRAEILSAQFNGVTMLILAAMLAVESLRRLLDPPDVDGAAMVVIGVVGAAVNLAAAWALSRADRRNMNVEGAFLHNLADLWSSVAAAVAGLVIVTAGWLAADSLAALTVCALMVRAGWGLVRDSGAVLLEGAPGGVEPGVVGRALAGEHGVVEVHDLHIWELSSDYAALSAHVVTRPEEAGMEVRLRLCALLAERFGIEHSTLQVEPAAGGDLLQIEVRP